MKKYKLTVVANSGRSGSTYLYRILSDSLQDQIYLAHEDIPVQISQPRRYNRAYSAHRQDQVLSDNLLWKYIDKWRDELKCRSVIETGWTCYHLLPVLQRVFGEQLQVIVLHREPWSVAMSRANMGNYHPDTWYDDAHQVSPFDITSIAPHFIDRWPSMNWVEKCLYWWYIVYSEVFEFKERNPSVPCIFLSSRRLFDGSAREELKNFIGYDVPDADISQRKGQNSVQTFMSESFPLERGCELPLKRHHTILDFAENKFGYRLTHEELLSQAEKYRLQPGIFPLLRHKTKFWKRRHVIGRWLHIQVGPRA